MCEVRKHIEWGEIETHIFFLHLGAGKEQTASVEAGRLGFQVAMTRLVSFYCQIILVSSEDLLQCIKYCTAALGASIGRF